MLKAGTGVKNSMTTFPHIVIAVCLDKTGLLCLISAMLSGFKAHQRIGVPIGCSINEEAHALPCSRLNGR